MVRRELGFDVQQWDALPWWQQIMYNQQLELDSRYQNWDSETEAAPDEYDPFEAMDEPIDQSPIFGMSVTPNGDRVDRVAHITPQGTAGALESMGLTVVRTTFGGQA